MKIVVCVKQVPDTTEIKINPETGTLIRDGVPSILNPDDANALEQALEIKDSQPDTEVVVVTMGPPQAKEMLRECLAMGADDAVLLSDRALGGSDTWATSNAVAAGVKKVGGYDLIFAGRQAIDGDTAQVGPQVAEKLGLNQVTYVNDINECDGKEITITRHIDGGTEVVKAPLPIMLTVNGDAAPCRPRNAKRVMKYKRAMTPIERPANGELPYAEEYEKKPYLNITQWTVADVDGDLQQCGLAGSPTKVKAVQNIVFKTKESHTLGASDDEINGLIKELLANHTIG